MFLALDCKAPCTQVSSPVDTKDVWTNNNIQSQVAVYTINLYILLINRYRTLIYSTSKLLQTI